MALETELEAADAYLVGSLHGRGGGLPTSLRGRRLLQQATADESAGYFPSASKPLARQPLLNTYTLGLSSAA